MSDAQILHHDDRWATLRFMVTDRRALVYRSTTDAEARQQADAGWEKERTRLAEVRDATLAREAAGDWHAEWDDLIAAVFGDEASEPDGSDRSVGSEATEPSV